MPLSFSGAITYAWYYWGIFELRGDCDPLFDEMIAENKGNSNSGKKSFFFLAYH